MNIEYFSNGYIGSIVYAIESFLLNEGDSNESTTDCGEIKSECLIYDGECGTDRGHGQSKQNTGG